MDTIKLLLTVTVALLVGALAMSWKNFRHQERETPRAELAEIQRQIQEIELENERLRLQNERIVHGEPETMLATPEAPTETPAPIVELSDAAAELAANRPALDFPAFPDDTEPSIPSAPGGSEERALAIRNAPAVAKISEWVIDPQIGSFATLEVLDAEKVVKGSILNIRRNSGILGKLKVNDIMAEGAIAGALTDFGALTPEVGDELIFDPAAE